MEGESLRRGEGKGLGGGEVKRGRGGGHSPARRVAYVYATPLLQHQAQFGLNLAMEPRDNESK